MKTVAIIILFFFTNRICLGQINSKKNFEEESEPLAVEYDIPKKGKAIRYYFPVVVDSLINVVVNKSNCKYFFMSYELTGDTTMIMLHTRCIGNSDKKNNKLDEIELLLSSTNRFYKNSNTVIPIYFDSDIRCAFPKFVFTGSELFLRFTGKYPAHGKLVEVE